MQETADMMKSGYCGTEKITEQGKWSPTNHTKDQSSSKGDAVYTVLLEGDPLL